jgi:hypothetical protein
MHPDHAPYFHLAGKARLDKAINSLLGIVEGIAIDAKINAKELKYLHDWIDAQRSVAHRHPFNELVPVVENALHDGVLTVEEKADILWLCERLSGDKAQYFDAITGDLQRLHALLAGVAADAVISPDEVSGLSQWLEQHEQMRTCWPYDEVDALVTAALRDRKIDREEHEQLLHFFSEFGQLGSSKALSQNLVGDSPTVKGLCAVAPSITFRGSLFCFTGASKRMTRRELQALVADRGGSTTESVGPRLNYLVIGAEGNPCWAYACYGRKVETAVSLRRQGHRIVLVHEYDFHDAVAG